MSATPSVLFVGESPPPGATADFTPFDCASGTRLATIMLGLTDRATMLARVQPPAVGPARQQPLASVAFANDAHLAKGMPCTVCHALDADVRSSSSCSVP